jgi:hypothetical protein
LEILAQQWDELWAAPQPSGAGSEVRMAFSANQVRLIRACRQTQRADDLAFDLEGADSNVERRLRGSVDERR